MENKASAQDQKYANVNLRNGDAHELSIHYGATNDSRASREKTITVTITDTDVPQDVIDDFIGAIYGYKVRKFETTGVIAGPTIDLFLTMSHGCLGYEKILKSPVFSGKETTVTPINNIPPTPINNIPPYVLDAKNIDDPSDEMFIYFMERWFPQILSKINIGLLSHNDKLLVGYIKKFVGKITGVRISNGVSRVIIARMREALA